MPGRILIVDDLANSRILLKARLAPLVHHVDLCATAHDAVAAASARPPDLVLVSESLPDNTGLTLCARLRTLPGASLLPVLLLGDTANRETRLAALRTGIDAFVNRRPSVDTLLARVRNMLHRCSEESDLMRGQDGLGFAEDAALGLATPGRISLIAPDKAVGQRWCRELQPLMRDQIAVMTPSGALAALNGSGQTDAIVIATDPDHRHDALRLLSDLRCRDETRRAAILLVQDRPDPEIGNLALDLGVNDLVETGFDAVEMALRLRRELARKARGDRTRAALHDGLRLAATDPLTGLYNRRYAMSELAKIKAESARDASGFAVMVLDLDRFKRINDTHGHAVGDAVLQEVAQRMRACLRGGDFLARIGGEEFLAVIRKCDADAAAHAAERLRQVVSAAPVVVGENAIRVTLSIGLVLSDTEAAGLAPEALVDRADKALYAAKAEGRNRVSSHRSVALA